MRLFAPSIIFTFLSASGAAEAAAILILHMIDLFKIDGRHFLHDSKLADAIAGMDFRIAQGDGVELPDVVFAAIFLFDDPH